MRVLIIGDVIGSPGRRAVQTILPSLRHELRANLVVANGENAAGGIGITPDTARELLSYGIDVITSGNHVWDKKEIIPYLDGDQPILRPLNYPPGVPGRGHITMGDILVVNVIGRVFMGTYDCPFRAMDRLLDEIGDRVAAIIVDIHAEATSEKAALAWYLDGRVSVVAGTHTHVATADARILPNGTAFVSDLGMVGPIDSVIGVKPQEVLQRFLTQTPHRLTVQRAGPLIFNSMLVDIDESTGKATRIERVDRELA